MDEDYLHYRCTQWNLKKVKSYADVVGNIEWWLHKSLQVVSSEPLWAKHKQNRLKRFKLPVYGLALIFFLKNRGCSYRTRFSPIPMHYFSCFSIVFTYLLIEYWVFMPWCKLKRGRIGLKLEYNLTVGCSHRMCFSIPTRCISIVFLCKHARWTCVTFTLASCTWPPHFKDAVSS